MTDEIPQVRHPYPGVGSELVAKRLASIVGVVVLPGSFFNPPFDDIKDDRYLRFCEY
jgi:aspartate/methionine/tyrosine aminotransferase